MRRRSIFEYRANSEMSGHYKMLIVRSCVAVTFSLYFLVFMVSSYSRNLDSSVEKLEIGVKLFDFHGYSSGEWVWVLGSEIAKFDTF